MDNKTTLDLGYLRTLTIYLFIFFIFFLHWLKDFVSVLVRPDDPASRSALDSCRHLSNKETVTSLHAVDRPITFKSKVDQVSKANPWLRVV